MVFNQRGRVAGVTADVVGNYEGFIYYAPPDYASAELIRPSRDADSWGVHPLLSPCVSARHSTHRFGVYRRTDVASGGEVRPSVSRSPGDSSAQARSRPRSRAAVRASGIASR